MHLRDSIHGKSVKELDGIVSVVPGIVEDVRNIEEERAIGFLADSPEKVGLAQGAMRDGKGIGHILQGKRSPETATGFIVVPFHPLHRDLFEREGEKHGQIVPVDPMKGEMLGENLDSMFAKKAIRRLQIDVVELSHGPDREAESMGDTGKAGQSVVEQSLVRIAVNATFADDVVFGGEFEQIDFGSMSHRLLVHVETVGQAYAVGGLMQRGCHDRKGRRGKGIGQGQVFDPTG
jgi:hypothetical protein